jgi:hypothetical protein
MSVRGSDIDTGGPPRRPGRRRATSSVSYSSKIIKAGALIADTRTLLAHWEPTASVEANLDRVRRESIFGKASRSRVEDILAIFRQRYLMEDSVTKALVTLVLLCRLRDMAPSDAHCAEAAPPVGPVVPAGGLDHRSGRHDPRSCS